MNGSCCNANVFTTSPRCGDFPNGKILWKHIGFGCSLAYWSIDCKFFSFSFNGFCLSLCFMVG